MKPVKRDGRVFYFCAPCGVEIRSDSLQKLTEKRQEPKEKKGEGVADERNVLAVHKHTCSKCGYDKAEIIELGVWYTDEDHNVLYRCGRCGHTEKEDAKVK